MNKFYIIFISFFSVMSIVAQEEINAIITINSDKIQSSNKQIYKTLQEQLTEFVNQKKWTDKKFLPQERINCAFTIIINEQKGNAFTANIQVQATRPVFESSYETPILNINDNNFNFKYNEFEPLIYNPNSFDSNLVSTVVFYIYTILGVDADTFKLKGGQEYLKKAESVMLQAQQTNDEGWENKIGKQNRYSLIDGLLDPKFENIRIANYKYHRKGIDLFYSDEKKAKESIFNSLLYLENLHNITIGNYMIRVFLDAKADEIVSIFSDGLTMGKEIKLKDILQRIAPTLNNKWKKIKS